MLQELTSAPRSGTAPFSPDAPPTDPPHLQVTQPTPSPTAGTVTTAVTNHSGESTPPRHPVCPTPVTHSLLFWCPWMFTLSIVVVVIIIIKTVLGKQFCISFSVSIKMYYFYYYSSGKTRSAWLSILIAKRNVSIVIQTELRNAFCRYNLGNEHF